MQVWDGSNALEEKYETTLIITLISGLSMTVVSVVVNAVGVALKLIEHIETPMITVEAVMMVTQLWNIAKIVCV